MTDIDPVSLNEACGTIADTILNDLGLRIKRDGTVRDRCPIHGGNNPTAFAYHPEYKRWSCYTQNCHQEYGSDFIGLVRGIRQCTFREALEYLYNTYFPDGNVPEVDHLEMNLARAKPKTRKTLNYLEYKDYNHAVQYFLTRGISVSTLHLFEAFQSAKYQRACLPIYDCEGNLVAFSGRDLTGNALSKWVQWPKDNDCKTVIYGLHITKSYIIDGHIFLVEGPIDVWRMFDAGIRNVGAILGSSVTTEQCKELMKCGVRQVTLMLDPDSAGKKAAHSISAKLGLYFKVNNLTEVLRDDPGELSDAELNTLCKTRI